MLGTTGEHQASKQHFIICAPSPQESANAKLVATYQIFHYLRIKNSRACLAWLEKAKLVPKEILLYFIICAPRAREYVGHGWQTPS